MAQGEGRRLEPRLEAIFENNLRTDSVYRNKIVQTYAVSTCQMIERRRIYCLTPDPLSPLMWSHYGDSHHGICLQFHVGNAVFLNAWEVRYADVYPRWTPQFMLHYVMDMILTKSECWSYEQEFRILATPDFQDGHPLKLDGDYIKLPPGALVGILVGCNGDYDAVAKIAGEYAPRVPVKRVLQIPYHYRLTVEGPADAAA